MNDMPIVSVKVPQTAIPAIKQGAYRNLRNKSEVIRGLMSLYANNPTRILSLIQDRLTYWDGEDIPCVDTTVRMPTDLLESFKQVAKMAGYPFDRLLPMVVEREVLNYQRTL
ncbi:MAG: hypothetical protein LBI87_05270 [Candidatus Accumulibacter sp.]|jgi:hypothetical protein|nr:hypothetical protein [Accumulibacter sp.]